MAPNRKLVDVDVLLAEARWERLRKLVGLFLVSNTQSVQVLFGRYEKSTYRIRRRSKEGR